MGLFDRIWVPCPECGTRNEFQSKTGECHLKNIQLEDATDDELRGIHNDTESCTNCGWAYTVLVSPPKRTLNVEIV